MSTFHRLDPKMGEKILQKNNYSCSACGSKEDVCVHHVKAMHPNDPCYNDEWNLTTLCRSCHMAHHRATGEISTKGYGRRGSLEVIYCCITGCTRPQHAQSLCKKHYTQVNRHKWKDKRRAD